MSITSYIQETRGELKHVTWLTRNQVLMYTLLVIGLSVVVSLFLFAFDFLFLKLLGFVIAQ